MPPRHVCVTRCAVVGSCLSEKLGAKAPRLKAGAPGYTLVIDHCKGEKKQKSCFAAEKQDGRKWKKGRGLHCKTVDIVCTLATSGCERRMGRKWAIRR